MPVGRKRVCYVYPYAFRYRKAFSERLKQLLDASGVDFEVIHCSDPKLRAPRGDLEAPEWAIDSRCVRFDLAGRALRYQGALRRAMSYDLVIMQQENGLLVNYPLQLLSNVFGYRTAFFGHGRNFQSRNPDGWAERFKCFWLRRVHWWFAYTERSAAVVEAAGFPRHKITVFNNAIDISAIREALVSIGPEEREAARRQLLGGSRRVGVYVGGLYEHKRIKFLLAAAREIRRRLPDFHFIAIGDGAEAGLLREAAAAHDWIHYPGARFGREKSLLVGLADVFLMPGLVGLAVLDAFAHGTPMVTTDLPYHSPEIDYLEDGVNGVIVDESGSVAAYADAVVRVIVDDAWRRRLQAGAQAALETYTIENMAERFAGGVLQALRDQPAPPPG